MQKNVRSYVAGHRGLVGAAIVRALDRAGCTQIITRSREELDLTDQDRVRRFFDETKPEVVFLAAARVGGIHANRMYPVGFLATNLQIQTNVIEAAYRSGSEKLLFFGSNCMYPRSAPQPMHEADLLTGELEPTCEAYAIAKIAGVKLCAAYRRQYGFRTICPVPASLYGPLDRFDPRNAHVVAGLLQRFHQAKLSGAREVFVWGTGSARRELLHVDDLADACLFLMDHYDEEPVINVGVGQDHTIRELAELIARTVGFKGVISWDPTQPEGVPRKLLDNTRLTALGFRPKIALEDGLSRTYRWYCETIAPPEPRQPS